MEELESPVIDVVDEVESRSISLGRNSDQAFDIGCSYRSLRSCSHWRQRRGSRIPF